MKSRPVSHVCGSLSVVCSRRIFFRADFLDLDLCLALGDEIGHGGYAAELAKLVGRDVEAEAVVDEDL